MKKNTNNLKKFWDYLWNDESLGSYILNFIVAFIFIKFLFFPVIGFVLNNDFPIVAIVSGSMEHKIVNGNLCNSKFINEKNQKIDFKNFWKICGGYYEKYFNLSSQKFKDFDYKNGLDIGDVMILYGKKPEDIKLGEVLVFIPQDKMKNGQSKFFVLKGPVIHRIVKKWKSKDGIYYFQTKGDHNPQSIENFETKIPQNDVIGIAILRIPYIGYAKIALNNLIIKLFY